MYSSVSPSRLDNILLQSLSALHSIVACHPFSVKAPTDATLHAIESKIIHRAAWIDRQQRQFAKYAPALPAPECVSGKGYRYLGRQYRLKLIDSENENIRLWQGRLEVNTSQPFDREHVETTISNWYRDRAIIIFGERYHHSTKLVVPHGIKGDGFQLRTMSKRWGSCTPAGRIFLNPLLISTPKDCIDYVIIHELCHRRFPNHSPSFYKLLGSILPDWSDRKQKLNTQVELRSRCSKGETPVSKNQPLPVTDNPSTISEGV
jgi:predicted metal-dependent hydrolase